jgi:anti-sigma-K factor RskA
MNRRELAAAYVLGELGPARLAEVERQLESDPELRAEVEALGSLTATLSDLPADAWPVATPESLPARPAAARAPRRVWRLRPAVAIATVLVALALGAGLGTALDGDGGGGGESGPELTLSGLAPADVASGRVTMPSPDDMVLTVTDLPRSADGQYYELWLLNDEETVPVASFRVGEEGTATVRVPLPVDPAKYTYFDVSRQRAADGTEHSADSVLRGPTAPAS